MRVRVKRIVREVENVQNRKARHNNLQIKILLYDDRIEIYFNSPIRTSPDDENRGFSFYRGTQRRTFKDPHKSEWTRIILEVVMKL